MGRPCGPDEGGSSESSPTQLAQSPALSEATRPAHHLVWSNIQLGLPAADHVGPGARKVVLVGESIVLRVVLRYLRSIDMHGSTLLRSTAAAACLLCAPWCGCVDLGARWMPFLSSQGLPVNFASQNHLCVHTNHILYSLTEHVLMFETKQLWVACMNVTFYLCRCS
jgi:hypothetical protein